MDLNDDDFCLNQCAKGGGKKINKNNKNKSLNPCGKYNSKHIREQEKKIENSSKKRNNKIYEKKK